MLLLRSVYFMVMVMALFSCGLPKDDNSIPNTPPPIKADLDWSVTWDNETHHQDEGMNCLHVGDVAIGIASVEPLKVKCVRLKVILPHKDANKPRF